MKETVIGLVGVLVGVAIVILLRVGTPPQNRYQYVGYHEMDASETAGIAGGMVDKVLDSQTGKIYLRTYSFGLVKDKLQTTTTFSVIDPVGMTTNTEVSTSFKE